MPVIRILVQTLLALVFVALTTDAMAEEFEQPLKLQADKILPPELLKGKLHSVDKEVVNDGYMNSYTIRSKVGIFKAKSTRSLEKRVAEVYMIHALREGYPTSQVIYNASTETAEGLITAPIKGAKKAYDTVSDPKKLQGTVQSIPGGVVNLFGVAASAVGGAARATYQAGSNVLSSEDKKSKEDAKKGGSSLGSATDFASEAALNYVGYSKTYRQLAETLNADPYSENETLLGELRRVAGLDSSIRFAGKFAPAIYGIPYVGTFNRYSDYADKIGAYEDPNKIAELNKDVLDTLGKLESFGTDKSSSAAFLSSDAYTPIMKRMIVDSVERLRSVQDFGYLLKSAGNAKSREIAQFYTATITYLATVHESEAKLRGIIRDSVVPAAVNVNHQLIVPLAVDHILWTRDVADIFRNTKLKVLPEYGAKTAELRISGTLSPRCKNELSALGVKSIKTKVEF